MKIGNIDLNLDVLMIAEIGNNHEGNLELAKELVKLAGDAGAHAVKFQTILPELLISQEQKQRRKLLDQFCFSKSQYEELAKLAIDYGVVFLSTPFYLDAVEWLDVLVPAFKIASGDNDFFPLIDKVLATGKPILLSTGLIDYNDAKFIASRIYERWNHLGLAPGLSLMHCVSSYPADQSEVNLACINELAKICDVPGYSDHTMGIEIAPLAVAAGARIVEKHFTKDKEYSDFRDHKLSADPKDFRKLADQISSVNKTLGNNKKQPTASEQDNITAHRRSIVAKMKLNAGHIITINDIDWLRPGTGISPKFTDQIIGRKLLKTILPGQPFLKNELV